MELVTLKQFAEAQNISYEAVRRQVVRYSDDLSDHIIRKDRTQYLDSVAVEFLKERRRESPIILTNIEQSEENERLKDQVETLKAQLLSTQNELIKEKDRTIALQGEVTKTIEDRFRYHYLLEQSNAKDKKIKESEDREEALKTQLGQIQKEAAELRERLNVYQKRNDELKKEKSMADTEMQSYSRTIFGFYRKKDTKQPNQ